MKKFYGIMGAISGIIGFVMFLSAQMVISTNSRYSWSKPYTSFEIETLSIKWIGLFLLISGILDIALIVISKYYGEKNIQDVNIQQLTTTVCPNCNIPVNNNTTVCPKCKNSLRR